MVCRHGVIIGQSRSSRLWEDFGGARGGSESPLDTALRELTQETGLTAGDLEFGDRSPVVIEHAGHVHVAFVASAQARSSAFVVASDGKVRSTASSLTSRAFGASTTVSPQRSAIALSSIAESKASGSWSRYMATLGSSTKGPIENHDGKIAFLEHYLPGVLICSNYHSRSYEEWPIWTVGWVGGGPPCVWCSRAGKQESNDPRSGMFCFGIAKLAKRSSVLVADVEQGHFVRYHGTTQRDDRPTLAGYIELSTVPLQRGSLVELTCDPSKRAPGSL